MPGWVTWISIFQCLCSPNSLCHPPTQPYVPAIISGIYDSHHRESLVYTEFHSILGLSLHGHEKFVAFTHWNITFRLRSNFKELSPLFAESISREYPSSMLFERSRWVHITLDGNFWLYFYIFNYQTFTLIIQFQYLSSKIFSLGLKIWGGLMNI